MTANRTAGFPPVHPDLLTGFGPPAAAVEFLAAVDRWRTGAHRWLATRVRRGDVSVGLGDLLTWALGRPARPGRSIPPGPYAAPGPYALAAFPEHREPGPAAAVEVLVWRSGVADFLADVWDTAGPPAYELTECTLVLDELLTPAVLRGVLACPDCLQVATSHRELAAHTAECPIRRRRMAGPV